MTCAFDACDQSATCPLSGGCVVKRFPQSASRALKPDTEGLKDNAPALNGTKATKKKAPPAKT